MIHRGEKVEIAIRKSGMTIAEVARRLKKSRRHIYNLFEDPSVPIDIVLQIGKIIHYNFALDIPEIKDDKTIQDSSFHQHNISSGQEVEFWKEKYLILLEKYNSLLEQQK